MAQFILTTTADEDASIAAWLTEINGQPGAPRTAESAALAPSRLWVADRLREHTDLATMVEAKAPQITKEDQDAIRAILEKYTNEGKR